MSAIAQALSRETMNQLHATNMAAIQTIDAELHQRLENHVPSHALFSYDDHGYLNINHFGKWLYGDDPAFIAQRHVDAFSANPARALESGHNHALQNMTDAFAGIGQLGSYSNQKPLPHVFFFGVAFGYHIPSVLAQHDVNHIIIVEPDIDLMYLSLLTTDYAVIISNYTEQGKSIQFFVDKNADQIIEALRPKLSTPWFLSTQHCFIFQHYSTPIIDSLLAQFLVRFEQLASQQTTVFDSLETVEQCQQLLLSNVLRLTPTPTSTPLPAIIIRQSQGGHTILASLKKIQDKFCIISCDSMLQQCLKIGIIPSFQVQLTENRHDDNLQSIQDKIKHHNIVLLTLNSAEPKLRSYFSTTIVGFENTSLSGQLIENTCDGPEFLPYALPGELNLASAFACALGFKSITLVGLESEKKQPNIHTFEQTGNFQDHILVSANDYSIKIQLEKLPRIKPDIQFYNMSNGVKVSGFQAVLPRDLVTLQTNNRINTKAEVIQSILAARTKALEQEQAWILPAAIHAALNDISAFHQLKNKQALTDDLPSFVDTASYAQVLSFLQVYFERMWHYLDAFPTLKTLIQHQFIGLQQSTVDWLLANLGTQLQTHNLHLIIKLVDQRLQILLDDIQTTARHLQGSYGL